MSEKESPEPVAELPARAAEVKAKLDADPVASEAVRRYNEMRALDDKFPKVSPVMLAEAEAEWQRVQDAQNRRRTKPNVVAAPEGVRALTSRQQRGVIEKAVVEGMVELPEAAPNEQTNVGGRAVVMGEDGAVTAHPGSSPDRRAWVVAVIALLTVGVALLAWWLATKGGGEPAVLYGASSVSAPPSVANGATPRPTESGAAPQASAPTSAVSPSANPTTPSVPTVDATAPSLTSNPTPKTAATASSALPVTSTPITTTVPSATAPAPSATATTSGGFTPWTKN